MFPAHLPAGRGSTPRPPRPPRNGANGPFPDDPRIGSVLVGRREGNARTPVEGLPVTRTVAQVIVDALADLDVGHVFGVVGDA